MLLVWVHSLRTHALACGMLRRCLWRWDWKEEKEAIRRRAGAHEFQMEGIACVRAPGGREPGTKERGRCSWDVESTGGERRFSSFSSRTDALHVSIIALYHLPLQSFLLPQPLGKEPLRGTSVSLSPTAPWDLSEEMLGDLGRVVIF